MKIKKPKTTQYISIAVALLGAATVILNSYLNVQHVSAGIRPITFPVIGPASFSDDFNAPRNGGIHGATDIIAAKGQQLVAAVDGTITLVNYPEPDWGYSIYMRDAEGYSYHYLHINDDTPGTNDGVGGPMNAYAPDMLVGNHVTHGQLIGWVGDSGFSNGVSHLHFEIAEPNGNLVDPYESLTNAPHLSTPNIAPQMPNELLPYNLNFKGGLSIAMGNFDHDNLTEMVTGAGAGGGPHIRFFDSDNNVLPSEHREFMAYDPNFYGGVDVAAGDVTGDGIDDIITGPGAGGGPHVRVFDLDGNQLGAFMAYDPNFTGGIHVAAADVDGDGKAEIITAPGPGGGPQVKVFKLDGTLVATWMAYDPHFYGGVDVAAADVTGDSNAEVITSPGPGGGPNVRVFAVSGFPITGFMAYDPRFTGGARVSAGNVKTSTSKAEILTVPWAGGGPDLQMYDSTGNVLGAKMFFERWWSGYYDVAAGSGVSKAAAGVNRRATIRSGL